MTREQILERWEQLSSWERDAWVADIVMGWGNIKHGNHALYGMPPEQFQNIKNRFDDHRDYDDIPNYSADISAAWKVVEKMISDGADFDLMSHSPNFHSEPFSARFPMGPDASLSHGIIFAKTAPEAICKAALLAVQKESGKGA